MTDALARCAATICLAGIPGSAARRIALSGDFAARSRTDAATYSVIAAVNFIFGVIQIPKILRDVPGASVLWHEQVAMTYR